MMWTELAGFWLMPLVGVGLAIVVVWLLATLWRPAPRSRGYQPLETLEERFARGEIDGEEFNLRRVELTKT